MRSIRDTAFPLILLHFLLSACQPDSKQANTVEDPMRTNTETTVEQSPFGSLPGGEQADLYTLSHPNGTIIRITNYGGIITNIIVPDRQGNPADIVLGFDSLAPYLKEHPYFGAIIGRYGNRIAGGKFSLDNVEYQLAVNNGPNHLHGGTRGFDKHLWRAETRKDDQGTTLSLYRVSADGEEGYPGELHVQVDYTLTPAGDLRIYYAARTNKKTILNLTNHTYFNLTGDPKNDILDHELKIYADSFLPVDQNLIPTGELRELNGGPFDFRQAAKIGKGINSDDRQIAFGGGYDHTWVLRKDRESKKPQLAAQVYEPTTGRALEVLTTEPGIQFYSGNFLNGTLTGKGNTVYEKRSGFCLETQHYPDSPNQPGFPSVELNPGETYRTTTVYRFLAK